MRFVRSLLLRVRGRRGMCLLGLRPTRAAGESTTAGSKPCRSGLLLHGLTQRPPLAADAAARPSLDGELLPFSLACGESNGRRTCAVTRRDSRLAAYFLPLTNRRILLHEALLRFCRISVAQSGAGRPGGAFRVPRGECPTAPRVLNAPQESPTERSED